MGHLSFLLVFCFDAFSSPEPGPLRLNTLSTPCRILQLISGAAMRQDRFFFVIKRSRNNGNRVREASISRGRIYAYVMPTS
jgi:hypothetical protein